MPNISAIASDITFGLGLLNSFGARVDVVGIYANGPNTGNLTSGVSSSIFNSLLGLDNTTPGFGQQFALARPLEAVVYETSRIMEHPIENGSMVADFHIIDPVRIEIPMVVKSRDYGTVYTQIRQAWINKTLLSVKTRTGVYQNMVVAEMPHDEKAEMFDVITIGLRLRQIQLFVQGTNTLASNFQPVDAANSNTVNSGLQAATSIAGNLLTTALSIASYAAVARKGFL